MKCPQCGQEMEQGRLYGKAPVLWSPKETKRTLLKGKEDVHLLDGSFPDAWICKACRKVIIVY